MCSSVQILTTRKCLNGVIFTGLVYRYTWAFTSLLFVYIYASCAIRFFKLLFQVNADVYPCIKYTHILLRSNAVFGAIAVTVHFQWDRTHTHTHTQPFNGPFSRTTQVSRYQKGKTNLDFSEARDGEWQWHHLGHMQVCTLLQTDNHARSPPLSFL